MSIENQVETSDKNRDNKMKNPISEDTTDPKVEVKGQTEQVESQTIHAAENLKAEIDEKKIEVQEESK